MTKKGKVKLIGIIIGAMALVYIGSYFIYRQTNMESAEQWSLRNKKLSLHPYTQALEVQSAVLMVIFYPLLEMDRDIFKTFVEFRKTSPRQTDESEPR